MNKRLLQFTIILTSLLSVAFVIQPNFASVSAEAGKLLVFDKITPSEVVFQGEVYLFGGTIFNNDTLYSYQLIDMELKIYHQDNLSENLQLYPLYYFSSLVTRNVIEPNEARTFTFEQEISKEWKVDENYTVSMFIHFKNVADMNDETILPYERWLGNSTLSVDIDRDDSPPYIYAVFVLLLIGILAFIIIGLVGWIRERRARQ